MHRHPARGPLPKDYTHEHSFFQVSLLPPSSPITSLLPAYSLAPSPPSPLHRHPARGPLPKDYTHEHSFFQVSLLTPCSLTPCSLLHPCSQPTHYLKTAHMNTAFSRSVHSVLAPLLPPCSQPTHCSLSALSNAQTPGKGIAT